MLKDLEFKEKNLNIRITDEDLNKIKAKAMQYANGNVSAWVTYAAKNYVPDKNELNIKKKRGR